jgi:hypothetical protein
VSTTESYLTHALPVAVQRYRHPGDGAPLVVITVGIPGVDAAPPVLARFMARDAARPSVVLGEGSFRTQGSGEGRVVQARTTLAAGTWDLLVIAAGIDSASTGVARMTLVTRAAESTLSLSVPLLRLLPYLRCGSQVCHNVC